MIARTTDATFVATIANHPAVRPWLGGEVSRPWDPREVMAQPGTICLFAAMGGIIFVRCEPGVYLRSPMFLPAGRGRYAKDAQQQALQIMFDEEGATTILTTVLAGNVAAAVYARQAGFEVLDQTPERTCLVLTKDRWRAYTARTVKELTLCQ